ncbi:phosphoribosylamine--glycine ligase [Herbiconiux sp. L3-i23]|uniref:phosphoribosylamine--glycine ligase n=1 Tax=Herbiconiux sp. L3-i23 TaxID=2905871 RepID=UPI0020656CF4|nr:phosphoribosylamine--glycine ligase [Herbiconiux sp. L3-i23]BDI24067.1 phosphoribosylamine--glycine ligase [Herbiconiux sp. L3-i23]
MRILVLGTGAREHAIADALLTTPGGHDVVVSPGNDGIAETTSLVRLSDITDGDAVSEFALANDIDLIVVGPEAPLIEGVADAPRERGIPVFGPGRAAAQIEGSKAFAKRIMELAGVPTGRAERAGTLAEAEAALDDHGAPYVVKADGLAAGKGVLVTEDRDAALGHVRHWLPSGPVLIEEFLTGDEVSLFFLSDGHDVLPLSPAQDYKRLRDGDLGPNTGGMGAYSPLPWLADRFGSERAFVQRVLDEVAQPVVRQLEDEGTPFIGLLYCGLILDGDRISVIEFNARFGDPETQVVLPRLRSPLGELLHAAASGELGGRDWPEFDDSVAVGVVLASEGYPEAPVVGRPITGFREALEVPGTRIDHAATAWSDDHEAMVSAGGRVLTVVAVGDDFRAARDRAYQSISHLRLEGAQYRHDIAEKVTR